VSLVEETVVRDLEALDLREEVAVRLSCALEHPVERAVGAVEAAVAQLVRKTPASIQTHGLSPAGISISLSDLLLASDGRHGFIPR